MRIFYYLVLFTTLAMFHSHAVRGTIQIKTLSKEKIDPASFTILQTIPGEQNFVTLSSSSSLYRSLKYFTLFQLKILQLKLSMQ
jgi:hypothetical protein